MLTLGPLLAAVVFVPVLAWNGADYGRVLQLLSLTMVLGLVLEGFGLYRHAVHLKQGAGEGDAAYQEQITTFGNTYLTRNLLLGVNTVLLLAFAGLSLSGSLWVVLWASMALTITVTALVGRALFYVLVIPTTMPGAFFWKNPAFQDHARDAGLAEMQQVGVQVVNH
jgi:hypothetical protein